MHFCPFRLLKNYRHCFRNASTAFVIAPLFGQLVSHSFQKSFVALTGL